VPGTAIAFDIGFVMDGYCSDFGRSLYFGPAPDFICGAYKALQQAVVETVAAMRPGAMRLCDLFGAVEKTLDSFGYGDYLRARLRDKVLGHNIGIDIHEEPWINPDCDMPLQAGMVMAVEPKLWHSGEYYLRVEDIVLVGEDSSEFLTTFDRTVFEL
jgi:Xaa-Pro dipeptidase